MNSDGEGFTTWHRLKDFLWEVCSERWLP